MPPRESEFEETEYRRALFDQLCSTRLLWEPGQVFENHVGFDVALHTTHTALLSLYGYETPLRGVALTHRRWISLREPWPTKELPPFKFNLFVQAKRPSFRTRLTKQYRAHGLNSPYWRFDVVPHQQTALKRLKEFVGRRAIVCYACPAFHLQEELYKRQVNNDIVENSSFPDVLKLVNHSAWSFSEPGARGVANSIPESSDGPSLEEQISKLLDREIEDDRGLSQWIKNLEYLAKAVNHALEPDVEKDAAANETALFLQARHRSALSVAERYIKQLFGQQEQRAMRSFLAVAFFSQIMKLDWCVAGSLKHRGTL